MLLRESSKHDYLQVSAEQSIEDLSKIDLKTLLSKAKMVDKSIVSQKLLKPWQGSRENSISSIEKEDEKNEKKRVSSHPLRKS